MPRSVDALANLVKKYGFDRLAECREETARRWNHSAGLRHRVAYTAR